MKIERNNPLQKRPPDRIAGPTLSFGLHHSCLGFTLIEMVLALGILGILLLAGQSAIRIAGHSLPDSNSPTYSAGNAQRALAQLSSELRYARSVTQMTANAITFTVAPRGADASPEVITYSWDGIVGDPLKRQYNSDSPVNLVTNVNSFSLLYDKRSAPAPTTYSTSAQTTLYSYDSSNLNTSASLLTNQWLSQSFTPNLPSNATSWTITSVKFEASQDTHAGGQFYVQIRPSSGGLPGLSALQQITVNGSSLSTSTSWHTVNFTSPITLPAGIQAAMTLQWVSNASYALLNLLGIQIGSGSCPPADILYQYKNSSGQALAYSSDSGNSWNTLNGATIDCYIYGTYTTPNAPTTNYYLEDVRASLQLGSSSDSAVRTGIGILNQPQVSGP